MSQALSTLTTTFPDLPFQANYPLKELSYFKIGGPAEVYIELANKDQIAVVVKLCQEHHIKLTIVGGASNVIIADEGIQGLVMRVLHDVLEQTDQTVENKTIIRAGTGLKMALLVSRVVHMGFGGLEYFLGVPGTLGGAVYNNSHYLAHLIGEHIHRVQVVNQAGELQWLSNSECEFAYDSSRFQRTKEVILEVEFALAEGNKEESQALIREATQYRADTQPLGIPNSGCIFQNTPNTDYLRQLFPQFASKTHVSGGFLIDQAGLKGTRVGDVEVSHKHAAFIINKGQGTAQDVKQLITQIKATVKDKFGVELREEVFYLG
ncbi:MAG TPA: UDP-N-acetylmuramate dehydrogenase [Vitreimonas sp.]|nr:UDP-N-acetylmuramate dehydrogenase [Vitreimonas sp.]